MVQAEAKIVRHVARRDAVALERVEHRLRVAPAVVPQDKDVIRNVPSCSRLNALASGKSDEFRTITGSTGSLSENPRIWSSGMPLAWKTRTSRASSAAIQPLSAAWSPRQRR